MESDKRQIVATTVECAVAAGICSVAHGGIMLTFAAIMLVPWTIYALTIAALRPQRRRILLIKVGMWYLAVSIIVSAQWIRSSVARKHGNEVVQAIDQHVGSFGTCPLELKDAGLAPEELKKQFGLYFYDCESGLPRFGYANTYMPFATDDFDFSRRQWMTTD